MSFDKAHDNRGGRGRGRGRPTGTTERSKKRRATSVSPSPRQVGRPNNDPNDIPIGLDSNVFSPQLKKKADS